MSRSITDCIRSRICTRLYAVLTRAWHCEVSGLTLDLRLQREQVSPPTLECLSLDLTALMRQISAQQRDCQDASTQQVR